eukprot:1145894-Pelagomonas_calceolata.AAC.2
MGANTGKPPLPIGSILGPPLSLDVPREAPSAIPCRILYPQVLGHLRSRSFFMHAGKYPVQKKERKKGKKEGRKRKIMKERKRGH